MSHSSRITRRRFLKQSSLAGVACALPAHSLWAATDQSTSRTVKDRAPLHPGAFYSLPLGSVRPAGWLRRQLEIQANGLTGHLDETWADVGPNSGWLGGKGESWERGPYFLDGLMPLACLLDDNGLKQRRSSTSTGRLTLLAPDGMIGPASPTTTGGRAW